MKFFKLSFLVLVAFFVVACGSSNPEDLAKILQKIFTVVMLNLL